jgi:type IV pilus assembly protein PilY1
MWEFTDAYLGKSWSVPTIARCLIGGQERSVVFMGSSYGNKDSKGYLFAVDAITGQSIGNKKLLTGAPFNVLPSIRAIDTDADEYADRIFVGCLQEMLFVVEIGPEADPNKWTSSHILSTDPGQPISVPTSLSVYHETAVQHLDLTVMAYFGTGKYFTLDDKTDLTLQSFYAVKDNAVKVGKGGLANQTNPDTCTPIEEGFGWYIDLVEGPGERPSSPAMIPARRGESPGSMWSATRMGAFPPSR